MKITSFEVFRQMLQEKSGLIITPDKSYLLESRLKGIAVEQGFPSVEALGISLEANPDPAIVHAVVEAMTTNETFFFRDTHPFEVFKDTALTHMHEKRSAQRKLRIWCAAASSGQEPYSLAMILKEQAAQWGSWQTEIVATDISADIIAQAKQGLYTQFEVQRGLPIQMLMKYFTQVEDKWQINQEIKDMIKYDLFNLLDSPTQLGQFDIVFCRNVLIYFEEETKSQVLTKIAAQLAPDGFLFLGGAETVIGLTDAFKPVPGQRGLYAKPDSVHIQAAAA